MGRLEMGIHCSNHPPYVLINELLHIQDFFFLSQSLTMMISSAFDSPLIPLQDDTEKKVCSCWHIEKKFETDFLTD